jgi:hypothetical protein
MRTIAHLTRIHRYDIQCQAGAGGGYDLLLGNGISFSNIFWLQLERRGLKYIRDRVVKPIE